MLNELLPLSGPARLPELIGPRLRLERVDLPMIDSSLLDTTSLIDLSAERLTASPTISPHCSHTELRPPAGAFPLTLRRARTGGTRREGCACGECLEAEDDEALF
jgi:hypothetical protein